MTRTYALLLAATTIGFSPAATSGARAQNAAQLDSTTIASFRWRAIGPANMAGRITDVEGIPSPSKTAYIAAASGGIWKTTNGGTTFRPVFDNERVISMGDLAIAPSDTNQIWAGTGEEDSRNSISPGGGIYKSTDGGRSWRRMGLEKTEHIGRVVVHPTNPNIVWVAALGAAWRPNPERGLYKTSDGGQTWRLVKFISDRAGFVDIAIHPTNPNVLWAASWERQRGPYFLKSGGPGSALWTSTDAGETWTKVEGGGLPATTLGRIGIDVSRSNPDYIYLMVEADTAPSAQRAPAVTGRAAQQRPSGLYRSTDGGRTWEKRAPQNVRPFYYSQVRVDPKNPERVYWSSTPVMFSDDGGTTARQATVGLHVDHHAMWIDPNDPNHFIVGNDGGIGITWDKGGNYDFINTMPLGQFYNVSYDMAVPYRVCGGLQDNGSWCGPSRRKQGPITNGMWASISGGDGFHTASDPTDPNTIYSESQGGNMGRINWLTGERVALVRPDWRVRYRQFEDSILIERPDTAQPTTREQQRRIADIRTRQRADSMESFIRWNWNTPFFLSPHNPRVFYAGGNRVVKSTNRGEDLRVISPDLSKRLLAKIDTSIRKTGGVTPDLTGAETYGTIVSLAESSVRPGILWAGTDDGNVWLTRNDGATWDNITGRFPGLPEEVYVSRIEPSRFDTATVYVSFDNHRRGDFTPYLFVSTDFGRTFRSIASTLPRGGPDFVHVVREDPVNRDLLFVGTDVGAYVSLDRGQSWQRFMTGLPTVPVHDLKIHPRDHELIAGTHGRSIWIVDIAPLEQMTRDVASRPVHLFEPKTAFQYDQPPAEGGSTGHKVFAAPSPAYGAEIAYRLASAHSGQSRVIITDARGDTLRTLTGPARAGLHRITWDFRGRMPAASALSPSQRRDSIVQARRTDAVVDSLVQAGMSRAALERLRARMASGEIGGFFGGGGQAQQRGVFTERPGEGTFARRGADEPGGRAQRQLATPREMATPRDTTALAARPPAVREGVRGESEGDVEMIDPSFVQDFVRLIRPPGQGGGGGGFGGQRLAPLVATGDYLVTLEVGGQRQRQVLRVERVGGASPGSIAAGVNP
jgi:photosystem II stability/assembly factor-like uncharacterized protein